LTARRGELYAASAAIGYGSAFVATVFALRTFQPVAAVVDRAVLATLVLGILVALRRRRGGEVPGASTAATAPDNTLVARGTRLVVLGLLGGLIFLAGQVFAVLHVGASIAAFVAGLYAVFAAVLAPLFLPERISARAMAGFGAALVGTALLAELDPGAPDVVGLGWGLLAAISFALFLVLARRWSRPYGLDGLTIAFTTLLAAALGFGAVVLVTDPASLLPPGIGAEAVVAMFWLVVTAAVGQVLTAASVRYIPASRSAAFLLLTPISATVLATVLLGERPSALQLAGGLLVLVGIAAATLPVSRRARSAVAGP
jgi:probable blue pigment (indigoidine) exporter